MGKIADYSILNANSLGDKRSGGFKYLMITIKSTFLFLFLVEIVYALIITQSYIFMKYVNNFLQFPTLLLDVRTHMPAEAL